MRSARARGWLLLALAIAGCDSIVVVEETGMRAEYTGSIGAYLVAGLATVTVTGAISHLVMRLRTPTRGYLFSMGFLSLALLAGFYLMTQPLITYVVVDRGAGTITVTSRAPRELLAEREQFISAQQVAAVVVRPWPEWLPTTPVRVLELVLYDDTRVPVDIGFDCLDMRTMGIRIANLTGLRRPDWPR